MSKIFSSLLQKAVLEEGVLLASQAMTMIENAYGKRAEVMRPQTLADMVERLCSKNGYEASEDEIIDAVNDYIVN